MNILVINCGSSSLKYQLRNINTQRVMASGVVERIGESMGQITQRSFPDKWPDTKDTEELPILNHEAAMKLMVSKLTNGVIQSPHEIDAIGHRVVQGGESFSHPVLVDENVMNTIKDNIPLAPLHNPANLIGLEQAMILFPETPNVAVFDTEFHQTLPRHAYMYPVPKIFYEQFKVRKYGFHGTSHKYVSKTASVFIGQKIEETSLITVHLGNGCSMAAIKNGKCIETSMGLTPLAGLMMGTRCGDIDPAFHIFLAKNKGLTLSEIDILLNKSSGLLGICRKNDMRDIHEARLHGDDDAQLAFEMFTYRVKATIGAYLAILGSVDAIVFTAGIGENDPHVRSMACDGLENFGINIDPTKNNEKTAEARYINTEQSRIKVLVVPTNEELEIAKATAEVVND